MRKLMDAIQAWIEAHLVPVVNRITATYWFSIFSDAILYIVPFSMVSAIPSMWSIVRKFYPALPDISSWSTYTFGLIGLFVVFIIPYNVCAKEERKDRSLIAGFTGIGAYMLCMNATATEAGYVFEISKFGAGGMFTSMVVGFFVGTIYKYMARFSFFGEDTMIPDFVKNWFDNILAILLSVVIAWLFTTVLSIDVFTAVRIIMSPLTGFAQTLPGTVLIALIMDTFFFFGISGWVFTPVVRPITQGAIAENAAMLAAGQAPTNINAFGFSNYYMIGGEGNTFPLAIMMLFAKSKKNKVLGRATIIPSLFNINEPLVFSTVVNNPFMFIPMILQAIIIPANSWIWLHFGWASVHTQMLDMFFLPNPVKTYILSGGDIRNAILVLVNLAIVTFIWLPFFIASDRYELKQEEKAKSDLEAKKAAKRAARRAREKAHVAAAVASPAGSEAPKGNEVAAETLEGAEGEASGPHSVADSNKETRDE